MGWDSASQAIPSPSELLFRKSPKNLRKEVVFPTIARSVTTHSNSIETPFLLSIRRGERNENQIVVRPNDRHARAFCLREASRETCGTRRGHLVCALEG